MSDIHITEVVVNSPSFGNNRKSSSNLTLCESKKTTLAKFFPSDRGVDNLSSILDGLCYRIAFPNPEYSLSNHFFLPPDGSGFMDMQLPQSSSVRSYPYGGR